MYKGWKRWLQKPLSEVHCTFVTLRTLSYRSFRRWYLRLGPLVIRHCCFLHRRKITDCTDGIIPSSTVSHTWPSYGSKAWKCVVQTGSHSTSLAQKDTRLRQGACELPQLCSCRISMFPICSSVPSNEKLQCVYWQLYAAAMTTGVPHKSDMQYTAQVASMKVQIWTSTVPNSVFDCVNSLLGWHQDLDLDNKLLHKILEAVGISPRVDC